MYRLFNFAIISTAEETETHRATRLAKYKLYFCKNRLANSKRSLTTFVTDNFREISLPRSLILVRLNYFHLVTNHAQLFDRVEQ